MNRIRVTERHPAIWAIEYSGLRRPSDTCEFLWKLPWGLVVAVVVFPSALAAYLSGTKVEDIKDGESFFTPWLGAFWNFLSLMAGAIILKETGLPFLLTYPMGILAVGVAIGFLVLVASLILLFFKLVSGACDWVAGKVKGPEVGPEGGDKSRSLLGEALRGLKDRFCVPLEVREVEERRSSDL